MADQSNPINQKQIEHPHVSACFDTQIQDSEREWDGKRLKTVLSPLLKPRYTEISVRHSSSQWQKTLRVSPSSTHTGSNESISARFADRARNPPVIVVPV